MTNTFFTWYRIQVWWKEDVEKDINARNLIMNSTVWFKCRRLVYRIVQQDNNGQLNRNDRENWTAHTRQRDKHNDLVRLSSTRYTVS